MIIDTPLKSRRDVCVSGGYDTNNQNFIFMGVDTKSVVSNPIYLSGEWIHTYTSLFHASDKDVFRLLCCPHPFAQKTELEGIEEINEH